MRQLLKDISVVYGAEKAILAKGVIEVVNAKVRAKNLFGWKHFIQDMDVDLVGYMIETDFRYSGGAYVACGMQSAIDHARYCSAAKRRGDYETVSLDKFFQVADENEDEKKEKTAEEICFAISIDFGTDFADEVLQFLHGIKKKLSEEVLSKLQSVEFIKWFDYYRGGNS